MNHAPKRYIDNKITLNKIELKFTAFQKNHFYDIFIGINLYIEWNELI